MNGQPSGEFNPYSPNPYGGGHPIGMGAVPMTLNNGAQLTNRRATAHGASSSLGGLSDTGSGKSLGLRSKGLGGSSALRSPRSNTVGTRQSDTAQPKLHRKSSAVLSAASLSAGKNDFIPSYQPPELIGQGWGGEGVPSQMNSDFLESGSYKAEQSAALPLGQRSPTPPKTSAANNAWNPMGVSPVRYGMDEGFGNPTSPPSGGTPDNSGPSQQQQQQQSSEASRTGVWAYLPSLKDLILPSGGDRNTSNVPLHQRRFGCPEDDLPLYEELGIDIGQIIPKTLTIFNPFREPSLEVTNNNDLAGPTVFAISNAALLLLQGKMEFSAVYAQIVIGSISFRMILSLMSGTSASLAFVVSSLGYGLVPNVILAVLRLCQFWILGTRFRIFMLPIAVTTILWSAWCASSFMSVGLQLKHQRFLLFYPSLLFYAVFAALTIL